MPDFNDPEGPEGPVIRPFADFLIDIHRGMVAVELAEELHKLVTAVRDTEKKGSITLTISVEPLSDSDALIVTPKVTSKIPEFTRKGAVFFADDDNNLVRESPDKPRLPLREVGGPKIESDDVIDAKSQVKS